MDEGEREPCEAGWKRGRRVLMEAGERGRRKGGRGEVELLRVRRIAKADEDDGLVACQARIPEGTCLWQGVAR